MRDEGLETIVIQPDRIEHSARRFDGARRRITDARKRGHRLGNDATDSRQSNKRLHLARVTESAGRDKNWIGEMQAIQRDGEPAQRSRLTSAASISSS